MQTVLQIGGWDVQSDVIANGDREIPQKSIDHQVLLCYSWQTNELLFI